MFWREPVRTISRILALRLRRLQVCMAAASGAKTQDMPKAWPTRVGWRALCSAGTDGKTGRGSEAAKRSDDFARGNAQAPEGAGDCLGDSDPVIEQRVVSFVEANRLGKIPQIDPPLRGQSAAFLA